MNVIYKKDFTLIFQLINADSSLEDDAEISFEIIECDSTSTNIILSENNIEYNSVLNCYSHYVNINEIGVEMPVGAYVLKWSIGTSVLNYPPYMIEEFVVHPNNDNIENNVESINELLNNMNIDLKKILGLVHENLFIDNTIYDQFNNMIGGRLRIYSNSLSVGTDNDIIATYQIECNSDEAGTFVDWKQVLI